MSADRDDPFEVLGIAPTGDRAAVKRAYFAALERHPPHTDGAGFARVRGAYEALMRPGALEAALFARFDVRAAFAELDAPLGPALAAALAGQQRATTREADRARFESVLPWIGWARAVSALEESPKR